MAKATAAKKIKITLIRSTIGRKPEQRATVKALGLKKIGSEVTQVLNPAIIGMVEAISHLVVWEEVK